jgi:CheY-like chemotaxis protein
MKTSDAESSQWKARMNTILTNTTVLVVDDDEDTCELLRNILEQRGANVVTANSAEAALALYRVHPPDIIVSDMRLGSSDGYAFITTIREYNREYRGFTPAIALTGFRYPGDEERAIRAGFNAYIYKPFKPVDLTATITRLLQEQRHDAA